MTDDIPRYFVKPGYIFVTDRVYLLHTVLGSCVSVCLFDNSLNIAGMNHIVYSKSSGKERDARFANIAIPHMLKLLLNKGCSIKDIKGHIVGGAYNPHFGNQSVSKDNIQMAENILKKNNIQIYTRDIGGEMGRKVIFNTGTGEIIIYKVHNVRKDDWYDYY